VGVWDEIDKGWVQSEYKVVACLFDHCFSDLFHVLVDRFMIAIRPVLCLVELAKSAEALHLDGEPLRKT
jgi:hypothetical protein